MYCKMLWIKASAKCKCKCIIIITILNTVVPPHIFVKTDIYFRILESSKEQHLFETEMIIEELHRLRGNLHIWRSVASKSLKVAVLNDHISLLVACLYN